MDSDDCQLGNYDCRCARARRGRGSGADVDASAAKRLGRRSARITMLRQVAQGVLERESEVLHALLRSHLFLTPLYTIMRSII